MKREQYIKAVLKEIYANKNVKKKIKEDLIERIDLAYENDPFFNLVEELGDPVELAKEFMENLDESELSYAYQGKNQRKFEYVSKIKIFGIPLIHILFENSFSGKVARGILAIGNVSCGVFSIGGVSLGIFSIGGVSAGIFSIGGVSLGVFSIGGIAVGVEAYGDIVLSLK